MASRIGRSGVAHRRWRTASGVDVVDRVMCIGDLAIGSSNDVEMCSGCPNTNHDLDPAVAVGQCQSSLPEIGSELLAHPKVVSEPSLPEAVPEPLACPEPLAFPEVGSQPLAQAGETQWHCPQCGSNVKSSFKYRSTHLFYVVAPAAMKCPHS